ncbi:MAG: SMP-30/gluconolactonase/LRE family protein [Minwuia sp.]|uniref:SMP-30/gluconolactonase/LRE family protein n=1 Tax=Minwuia sp. TaxID=2493630 RepID=UPI003A84983A
MSRIPETLVDGLRFGEGPRWHQDRLWYSDFYAHHVRTVNLAGEVKDIVTVPNQPSGLGFAPDGSLLIVSMLDRKLLRFRGGALDEVADLSDRVSAPCNDMVVDAQGRAYVGNFGFERHKGEKLKTTSMWRVDPDGSIHEAAGDLTFPNGTVITPDGKTLIVGETFGMRLTAFDVDGNGNLSNRRLWAEMEQGVPDGICLDAEGAIWVADPRGKRIVRYAEGGRILDQIPFGERGAYACMLGGPAGKHLFIITNEDSGPGIAGKSAGRIEVVEVETGRAGLP